MTAALFTATDSEQWHGAAATFAVSVSYADTAGEPGPPVSVGEFFTVLDATQFAIVQSAVFAATRERPRAAVTIVRCPVDGPAAEVFAAAGTPGEITDAVGVLLAGEVSAS